MPQEIDRLFKCIGRRGVIFFVVADSYARAEELCINAFTHPPGTMVMLPYEVIVNEE